jgi:hypothetical protein
MLNSAQKFSEFKLKIDMSKPSVVTLNEISECTFMILTTFFISPGTIKH